MMHWTRAQRGRVHFARANVYLHVYSDGRLAIFHGLIGFDPGERTVENFDATE
jgi:hypothetical protein